MGQQVRVHRDLQFVGVASHTDNVEGNISTKRMCIADYFWYDSQANYTVTLDGLNDAVAAIAGGINGLSLLSGDTDNDVGALATGLIFDITQSPEIEAKVAMTTIAETSFYFGFGDSTTLTTPHSTIDYADGTLADAITDGCGFVSDADKSSSLFYAAYVKTGGTVAAVTTGITPVNSTYNVLRLKLDTSGNATFYVDGVVKAFKAAAVTDVPLCAIFNFGTRANGGGDAIYVKYLKMWQDV